MGAAKVSICIPAYGNSAYVRRLLDSIRIQTYKDYEVIITDDSPDDEVKNTAEEYSDLPIRYVKNKTRLGATGNNNAAISLATGEYIKPMHHDDAFLLPDSLGRFVQMLDEDPDAVLAFAASKEVFMDEKAQVDESRSFDHVISEIEEWQLKVDKRNLYLVNMIGAPSAVMVKNNGCLMDEELTWLVDLEYYMRLLPGKGGYVYTKDALVSIGHGPGELTDRCVADHEMIVREMRYVYIKHDLKSEKPFRKHLVRTVIREGMGYKSLSGTDIGRGEYLINKVKLLIKAMGRSRG